MLQANQKGVGIIEVLVALLIASIGLLGIVAVQTNRVRLAQQEVQLSMATILAAEMVERMRANVNGVNSDLYNNADTTSNTLAKVTCNPCTKEQIAANDLYEWKQKIEKKLVDGKGSITEEVDGQFLIELDWTDKNRSAGEDAGLPPDQAGNPGYSIKVIIKDFKSEV